MNTTPGLVLHGASRIPPVAINHEQIDETKPSSSTKPRSYFTTPEHHKLGNSIDLSWPSDDAPGSTLRIHTSDPACKFNFHKLDKDLNTLQLSYGDISSMAGDFYGTYRPISDGVDLDDRIHRFMESWYLLAREKGSVAEYDEIMKVENDMEVNALKNRPPNQSASEAYSKMNATKMTKKWYDATCNRTVENGYSQMYPGYLGLVVSNWDHFGEDAHKSYIAGHTAALRQASNAKGDTSQLKLAYAMNAFADHFLEDSFSAGHLRTPRRHLHNSNLNLQDPNWEPLWKFWEELGHLTITNVFTFLYHLRPEIAEQLPLADLCANLMHNEESAIGLQVTNKRGDSWLCVGDDYLEDIPAGVDTKKYCIEAIQKSVDEVYDAFTSGKVISADNFGALQLVPIIESEQKLAPMFKVNDAGVLERRGSWLFREAFKFPPWEWNIERADKTDYTANFLYATTYVECFLSGRWDWPVKL